VGKPEPAGVRRENVELSTFFLAKKKWNRPTHWNLAVDGSPRKPMNQNTPALTSENRVVGSRVVGWKPTKSSNEKQDKQKNIACILDIYACYIFSQKYSKIGCPPVIHQTWQRKDSRSVCMADAALIGGIAALWDLVRESFTTALWRGIWGDSLWGILMDLVNSNV
jgi:hypothetical protein